MSAPSSEFLALQSAVAGRYSLERELGRGGMGIVFLARDVALNRPVAIKLLPAAYSQQPDMRERFVREARTAAGLFHPNIVPIEAALAIAIDDLIRALPKDLRARFGHARDVTRRLEATANTLRERDAKLSDAIARVDMRAPSASQGGQEKLQRELELARTGIRERLATTVATIETIRLDLLRLQAGVGGADHLTAEIEKARDLGEAVDAELDGRREVELLLRPSAER